MLHKALENNFHHEALMLIINVADLNSLDYIFAKELENIKKTLNNILGNKEYIKICKHYSENRIREIKRMINNGHNCLAKTVDGDTAADTTILSGTREVVPSIDLVYQEDNLEVKIKEI